VQTSVTVTVQPTEIVHERLRSTELLVALSEHVAEVQPAVIKAGSTWLHSSELSCESDVPEETVKSNGSVSE
jgi:hypothetical protein